jgi:ABC-type nitrate/sulfonate/bicarbonate transport system permease component
LISTVNENPTTSGERLLPFVVLLSALLIWSALSLLRVFPESVFPSPTAVARGFVEELSSGRLIDDILRACGWGIMLDSALRFFH